MLLGFDPRRLAEAAARAELERKLRSDRSVSALLDILDATDDRPKATVHQLRKPPGPAPVG